MKLTTVAILLLCAAASAQDFTAIQQPIDIEGWGKVKWGMTVEEARKATAEFQSEPPEIPGPNFTFITKIVLGSVPVGDLHCKVSIQAKRNSETIVAVTLTTGPVDEPPSFRATAFDTLKRLLIQKYGQPKSDDRRAESGHVVTVVLWNLPSTTITLKRSEGSRYGIGYVSLQYAAVDKKALDII